MHFFGSRKWYIFGRFGLAHHHLPRPKDFHVCFYRVYDEVPPIVELDCYRPYLVDNDGYKWLNSARFDLPRFKRPRQEVIQILRSKTCAHCYLFYLFTKFRFVSFLFVVPFLENKLGEKLRPTQRMTSWLKHGRLERTSHVNRRSSSWPEVGK